MACWQPQWRAASARGESRKLSAVKYGEEAGVSSVMPAAAAKAESCISSNIISKIFLSAHLKKIGIYCYQK